MFNPHTHSRARSQLCFDIFLSIFRTVCIEKLRKDTKRKRRVGIYVCVFICYSNLLPTDCMIHTYPFQQEVDGWQPFRLSAHDGPPRTQTLSSLLMRIQSFRRFSLLTPSLPWCHLKTTNKSAKFEILKPFRFIFWSGTWVDFHQNVQHSK